MATQQVIVTATLGYRAGIVMRAHTGLFDNEPGVEIAFGSALKAFRAQRRQRTWRDGDVRRRIRLMTCNGPIRWSSTDRGGRGGGQSRPLGAWKAPILRPSANLAATAPPSRRQP